MDRHADEARAANGLELVWSTLPVTPRHHVIETDTGVHGMTALPSPDGRTLLALSGTDGIRLWDPETAQVVKTTPATHARDNWSILSARLPSGRVLLVTSGVDGVQRWDPDTCLPVGPALIRFPEGLHQATDAISMLLAATTLADGRVLLVTGDIDGVLQRWDLETGARVGGPLHEHVGAIHALTTVQTSAGPVLVSAGNNDGVWRWDPETGTQIGPPIHPGSRTLCQAGVTLADGSVVIATAGKDLRLWNLYTGAEIGMLYPHQGFTMCAVPLPGRRPGLAVYTDSGICLWDLSTFERTGPAVWHSGLQMAALPLSDGRTLLVTGGDNGTVRLWDPVEFDTPVAHPTIISAQAVTTVPMRSGRVQLAVAVRDRSQRGRHTVQLWDPATGTPADAPLSEDRRMIGALATVRAPDGRILLAVGCGRSEESVVRLWDPVTETKVESPLARSFYDVRTLTSVPMGAGRTALVTGGIRGAQPWDALTGEASGPELTGHTGPVHALAPLRLSDGRVGYASGANDGVYLWDPDTGAGIASPLIGTAEPVWALATIPKNNGGALLIIGGSKDLTVWDYPSCELLTTVAVEWKVNDVCAVSETRVAVAFEYGVALYRIPVG